MDTPSIKNGAALISPDVVVSAMPIPPQCKDICCCFGMAGNACFRHLGHASCVPFAISSSRKVLKTGCLALQRLRTTDQKV